MTEPEWLAITDPLFLLEFFRRTSERKLRLFAVACCRRMWELFADGRSRKAVEVAEQFAEGLISEAEFEEARWTAVDAYSAYSDQEDGTPESSARVAAADAACSVCWDDFHPANEEEAYGAARATCRCLHRAVARTADDPALESSAQLGLLRCIFRSPFRPATIDPAWQSLTVVSIARRIYEDRRFTDLPILADALEDAGCNNQDLLKHCRSGGEHVRGCWPLDHVLGKA